MVESIQGNQHLKIIYKSYGFTKGSLISALVPLPTKGTKSPPYSRTFEFAALYSKQLIQIFCSGEKFCTFFGNGTKVKIPFFSNTKYFFFHALISLPEHLLSSQQHESKNQRSSIYERSAITGSQGLLSSLKQQNSPPTQQLKTTKFATFGIIINF